MKFRNISLIINIFSIIISAQTNRVNITFQVFSKNLNQSDSIFISGNNVILGNWMPGIISLDKKENHWEKTFTFPKNAVLEFKFTKGTWQTEALDEKGNIPANNILRVTKDTVVNYNIDFWNCDDTKEVFAGQITGMVKYHKGMGYPGILSRDIIVWLPPGYDIDIKKSYPVLYMQDGQNIFDPQTSFALIDWQIDETADSLIRNGNIEPMIIVGIYNTLDRSEEYSDTVKGKIYMQFIVNKLKPLIDRVYRTLPDRFNTSVGGSSSGGLLSFMLGWNYPEVFSKTACFAPAFKYDHFDYTKTVREYSETKKDIKIYIENGGIGIDTLLQHGVDLMIDALQEKGYKIGQDLYVDIDPTAEHNEISWSKKIPKMMNILFGR